MYRLAPNILVKENKIGAKVYYWVPHWRDRKKGCPVRCATLGADLNEANRKARELNSRVELWRNSRLQIPDGSSLLNVNSVEICHAEKESRV